MQTVTIPRLVTFVAALKDEGGSGTTIVVVDRDQREAAIAFLGSRADKATGDWRIEVVGADPAGFQGEVRRKFEDAIWDRDRTPSSARVIYVTHDRFFIIPSVKDRVTWLDARGRPIPHPPEAKAPRRLTRRPAATDTIWHQEHRGDQA